MFYFLSTIMLFPKIEYSKEKKFSSSSSQVAQAVYPSGDVIPESEIQIGNDRKIFSYIE